MKFYINLKQHKYDSLQTNKCADVKNVKFIVCDYLLINSSNQLFY
jgi:hypothetical protein